MKNMKFLKNLIKSIKNGYYLILMTIDYFIQHSSKVFLLLIYKKKKFLLIK